jgi:hypothetical protein
VNKDRACLHSYWPERVVFSVTESQRELPRILDWSDLRLPGPAEDGKFGRPISRGDSAEALFEQSNPLLDLEWIVIRGLVLFVCG